MSDNGWAGFDPHDVKGSPLFMWLLRPHAGLPRKVVRRAVFSVERYFPRATRALFGIEPTINAKGMALFARAYLQLFRATGEERYRRKGVECLDWLTAHPSPGYDEPCWGYPFDWQSGVVTPAGTPASVVTSAAADAFWTAWQTLGDEQYLKTCEGICRFFLTRLNQDRMPDGTICFSYTPLDDFHVHNANLMVAEQLVRVGRATGRREWEEIGVRAAAYALKEQNADGSIYYWGRVQDFYAPRTIDHYHSGFEIRSLHAIGQLTERADFREAARRYYAFYLEHLIERSGESVAPKMTPRSFYPVNIHSCAEALVLNATLAAEEPEARRLLQPLVEWVIARMQTDRGYFIYMIHRMLGREVRTTIPYLRWGQAWMMLALSQCVLASGETP